MKITSTQRVLGVQRLSVHFVRNLAFYRAARNAEKNRLTPNTKFWRIIDGDFVDVAILDWCKLLGEKPSALMKNAPKSPSRYGWEHVIGTTMGEDPGLFRAALLRHLGMNEDEFEKHRIQVRVFRDKFVAHLDDAEEYIVPNFDVPLKAVLFMFEYVTAWALKQGLQVYGAGLQAEYEACLEEGKAAYAI
jgi:hypothetical protein